MWDTIPCPCPWNLLLAHTPSYEKDTCEILSPTNKVICVIFSNWWIVSMGIAKLYYVLIIDDLVISTMIGQLYAGTAMLSLLRNARHWLHRKFTFGKIRRSQWWLFRQNDDCFRFRASTYCSELMEAKWHFYASAKQTITGSDNVFSPVRWKAIILTNAGLSSIGTLGQPSVKSNRDSTIFIQENAENVVWKMAAIFVSVAMC